MIKILMIKNLKKGKNYNLENKIKVIVGKLHNDDNIKL